MQLQKGDVVRVVECPSQWSGEMEPSGKCPRYLESTNPQVSSM